MLEIVFVFLGKVFEDFIIAGLSESRVFSISEFRARALAVEVTVGMSLLIIHEGKPRREVDFSDDGCVIRTKYPDFKRHSGGITRTFNLFGKNGLYCSKVAWKTDIEQLVRRVLSQLISSK